MKLSVIIPAYNEEKRIYNTLLDIDHFLSKKDYDYEILVVNDGSKDKTVEVVEKATRLVNCLKLINNSINKGKGGVVKQGMLEAKGDYRLFMDADNSTTIDNLDKFLPYAKEGYDVIIGSISLPGSEIHESAAWYRRLLGRGAKLLIRLLTIWEIHDTQRGFKLFSAKAAEEIFSRQTIIGWGFDIEILIIAKKKGFKIKEVPVKWNNPGDSKITLKSYFLTLKELLRIKWNMWRGIYDK